MATTWQFDAYSQLLDLAESLDDHVSRREVAVRLRDLADSIQGVSTITVNLESGAWESDSQITGDQGAMVASSVLPGMPPEEIVRTYGAWMSNDPETVEGGGE